MTITAAATDTGGSGVQKVVFEARPAGTADWYPICERTAAPYTCSADSNGYAPDGDYEIRAVTYDNSGNTTPSALVPLRIDNTLPTGAVVTPVPTLSGTVAVGATAADNLSGVASVRIERVTANQAGWTALCTDTVAPYACDWAVPAGDQLWDLRAVITDQAGNVRTSAVVEDRPGGTRPAGADVQGANGGVAGHARRRRHVHLHLQRGDRPRLDRGRLERRRAAARDRHGRRRGRDHGRRRRRSARSSSAAT